jgi:hypothetical protein
MYLYLYTLILLVLLGAVILTITIGKTTKVTKRKKDQAYPPIKTDLPYIVSHILLNLVSDIIFLALRDVMYV